MTCARDSGIPIFLSRQAVFLQPTNRADDGKSQLQFLDTFQLAFVFGRDDADGIAATRRARQFQL